MCRPEDRDGGNQKKAKVNLIKKTDCYTGCADGLVRRRWPAAFGYSPSPAATKNMQLTKIYKFNNDIKSLAWCIKKISLQ
jgi:hypothetical protein